MPKSNSRQLIIIKIKRLPIFIDSLFFIQIEANSNYSSKPSLSANSRLDGSTKIE